MPLTASYAELNSDAEVLVIKPRKRIVAKFFKLDSGKEPVRDWLKGLSREDRKKIGEDIKTVEYGWPIGMPVCRPLPGTGGLYEVRSNISGTRIVRVLFFVNRNQMILLHGFIKKSEETSEQDKKIAKHRKQEFKQAEQQQKKTEDGRRRHPRES